MHTAIDLFAGLGGWTTGGRASGLEVLWAANHWPAAVKLPQYQHVPARDILDFDAG